MRTRTGLLVSVLLMMSATPSEASFQQIFGGATVAPSTTATNYFPLMSAGGAWNTTEVNMRAPSPLGGTLLGLRCTADTNPGAAKTYALTVMKNGAATTLVCTMTNAIAAQDLVDRVSIVAGDTLSIRDVPTGTPVSSVLHWSLIYQPTTDGDSIYLSVNNTLAATKRYVPPGVRDVSATESDALTPVALGGTFKSFYIECNNAAGAGKTLTMTFRRGVAGSTAGTATSIKTTISGSAQTTNSDTVDTVAATAGDVVAYEEDNTGAGNNTNKCRYGIGFAATLPGGFLAFTNSSGVQASTTATNYAVIDGQFAADTTESTVKQLAQPFTVFSIYVQTSAAPGGSASYAVRLRQNAANATPGCTVTGAAMTCNAFATDTNFANDDTLTYSIVPSGTPTAAAMAVGLGLWMPTTLYGSTVYGATIY